MAIVTYTTYIEDDEFVFDIQHTDRYTCSLKVVEDVLDRFRASASDVMIIDLTGIHNIDSSSVGTIVSIMNNMKKDRKQIWLRNVEPKLKRTLDMLKVTSLIPIEHAQ